MLVKSLKYILASPSKIMDRRPISQAQNTPSFAALASTICASIDPLTLFAAATTTLPLQSLIMRPTPIASSSTNTTASVFTLKVPSGDGFHFSQVCMVPDPHLITHSLSSSKTPQVCCGLKKNNCIGASICLPNHAWFLCDHMCPPKLLPAPHDP